MEPPGTEQRYWTGISRSVGRARETRMSERVDTVDGVATNKATAVITGTASPACIAEMRK